MSGIINIFYRNLYEEATYPHMSRGRVCTLVTCTPDPEGHLVQLAGSGLVEQQRYRATAGFDD
ncbi:MAG TPA: hypothetical protein VMR98_06200, partial [Candidatus Polarisedimenticolaceae bacterium]|nr:hypothetical protein [Candidatus Polarisedimenticolaceae bacterium]